MSGAVESVAGLRRLRPYDAYADSGVLELGSIPVGWSAQRLVSIGIFSASGIDKKSIDGEVAVRMANYTDVYGSQSKKLDGSIEFMRVTCLAEKQRAHSLLAGDILFTPSSETPEEIGFSAVVIEDLPDTVYSYHLIRLRPHNRVSLDLRFSKYFCNNVAVLRQFQRACKGTTRQILTRDDFRNIRVAVPSLDEQRAIGEFLDRETGGIDALVAKKERLIELLREKRTTLITHTVTKGLDPTAPTKLSGIDWLGDIPAHWEVKPLKRCIDRGTSISYGIVQPGPHVEDGVPFVQTTNISGTGDFALDRLQRTTFEIESAYPRSRIKPGDILLGIRASIGAAHIVPDHLDGANLSRGVARIVPGSMLTSKFLVHYLWSQAVFEFWGLGSQGTTFSDVPIGTVRELPVPIPPPSEQATVVKKLELQLDGIDRLLDRIRDAVARLHEFRTALISAAVTGKIDVREEVE